MSQASPLSVLVVGDPDADFAAALCAATENDSRFTITVAKAPVGDATIEVLVAGRPAEELLDACPSLRWVVVPFAGIPRVTAERLLARPSLSLANLHHNAAPTAEHAIALLLAAAKKIVPADRALRGGDWRIRYETDASQILAGKRALLLGVGAIGERIARVLSAFDIQVRGIVRDVGKSRPNSAVTVLPSSELDAELPRADLLICTLPDTDATRRWIDARRLSLLPVGAILVNVGRAAVIEEEALYHALGDGPLAAAGIDVWYHYPENEAERRATPPGTQPFGELENVVLSPHHAGHGAGVERLRAEHLVEALEEIKAGRATTIDLSRGY